jgi:amino acid permease
MESVSKISLVAMISIVTAILYIIMSDIDEILNPSLDKTLTFWDFSGFPYFYGIASFMFEGNAVQLEIYGQMTDPIKNFTKALGNALLFSTGLIILLGAFSYAAYGQYTYGVILLNLEPSIVTYTVQLFYAVGILCGYCLMIIPTFKIIKHVPLYHKMPEISWRGFTHLKSTAMRLIILLLCCTMAYNIPDLG